FRSVLGMPQLPPGLPSPRALPVFAGSQGATVVADQSAHRGGSARTRRSTWSLVDLSSRAGAEALVGPRRAGPGGGIELGEAGLRAITSPHRPNHRAIHNPLGPLWRSCARAERP